MRVSTLDPLHPDLSNYENLSIDSVQKAQEEKGKFRSRLNALQKGDKEDYERIVERILSQKHESKTAQLDSSSYTSEIDYQNKRSKQIFRRNVVYQEANDKLAEAGSKAVLSVTLDSLLNTKAKIPTVEEQKLKERDHLLSLIPAHDDERRKIILRMYE